VWKKNEKRILLIEDNDLLIKIYTIKLKKEGYTIDVCHNGREGLEKLRNNYYSLILLDLMMPIMDGYDMLRNYQSSKIYKKAPIIILTNLGQQEDISSAEKLGITKNNYIVKAKVTPNEVISRINETIKENQLKNN